MHHIIYNWILPYCVSFLLLVASGSHSIGQVGLKQQEIIPKTPTVANFEKFISNPVDLHVGKQNINLPLHTITLGKLSIPIELRYNSSGMKVNELADFVGLGWSLSTCGVVSSNVNGLPDDIDWPGGYYAKISNPSLFTNIYLPSAGNGSGGGADHLDAFAGGDIEFLRNVYRGDWDSQPDTYFFSTPTVSGKFFFDEDGLAHTIPYSKNRIKRTTQSGRVIGYIITDESGNEYQFNHVESSETTFGNSCNPEGSPSQTHKSFYLTRITTPGGDTVDYYYSDFNYSAKNPDQGSRSKVRPSEDMTYCSTLVFYPCITTSITYFTGAKRLDKITTSHGDEIKFNYQAEGVFRKDLPNGKALESVEILSQGTPFKKFLFTYDYFYSKTSASTNPDDFRLKLRSFREENKEPYQFEYFEGAPPSRLAETKDHWGFSNRTGTLFPFDKENGFDGGTRDPDLALTQVGVLRKITYPTKGYLELEYELNDIFVDYEEILPMQIGLGGVQVSAPDTKISDTFTIPPNAWPVHIDFENLWDGLDVYNDWCYVTLSGPGVSLTFFKDSPNNNGEFYLPSGQYTVTVDNVGSKYGGRIGVYYLTEVRQRITENRKVGGLRISKAKNCLSNGFVSLETVYEYSDGQLFGAGQRRSSGNLFYDAVYVTDRDRHYFPAVPNLGMCENYDCSIMTQSSSSLTPIANSQGTHIVYGMVTVYNKDTTMGREVHKFLVDQSGNRPWVGFPYPPLITCDWLNGLPEEDALYDASENLVSKTKYYYNYTSVASRPYDPNEKIVSGIKIDIGVLPLYCYANETLTPVEFVEGQFTLLSSWHYLKGKEEARRDTEGQMVTTTTDYFYEDPVHIQKTSEQTTDSKGRRYITYFSYPLDYAGDVMNGSIAALNTANIITPVVSAIDLVNNLVVGSVVNELNAVGNPVSVYQLETSRPLSDFLSPSKNPIGLFTGYMQDTRYKKRVNFLYNSKQDVVEISNDFGDVTSYLWGCRAVIPLLKLKMLRTTRFRLRLELHC